MLNLSHYFCLVGYETRAQLFQFRCLGVDGGDFCVERVEACVERLSRCVRCAPARRI